MKKAALAYALLVLVVGGLVTAVTSDDHSEPEAEAKEAPAGELRGPEIAERVAKIRGREFEGGAPAVRAVPEAEVERAAQERPDEGTRLLIAHAGVKAPEPAAPEAVFASREREVLVSSRLAEEDPEAAEHAAARELALALEDPEAPSSPPLFRDDEAALAAVHAGAADQVAREYGGGEREETEGAPLRAAGARYVARLHERGGWEAVDEALREPPATTRQLLHPDATEQPARTPDFALRGTLGSGWQRLASARVGEHDTIVMLSSALAEPEARRAAAAWRAGRFETWTRREGCAPPCRRESASVVVWRLANPRESLAFQRSLRAVVEAAGGRPEGGRGFTVDDGGAAVVRAGRFAALTFAPDAPKAGELAAAALEG